MQIAFQSEHARIAAESVAMEVALASRSIAGATGASVWKSRLDHWQVRGVLERIYSRRPRKTEAQSKRKKLTDLRRARNLPPVVTTGAELIELGEKVWQDRAMLAKAVEMWDDGMSSGAVRQVQCSRIGWARQCKANGHLWHQVFRCGLRFCPLCMPSVYESLFYEAIARLAPVADRLVPEWPVVGNPLGELSLRLISRFGTTEKCLAQRKFAGLTERFGGFLLASRAKIIGRKGRGVRPGVPSSGQEIPTCTLTLFSAGRSFGRRTVKHPRYGQT